MAMYFVKEETIGVQHPSVRYMGPMTREQAEEAIDALIERHKKTDDWQSQWGSFVVKTYEKFFWSKKEIVDQGPGPDIEEVVYRVDVIATTPIDYWYARPEQPVYVGENYNKNSSLDVEALKQLDREMIELYQARLKETQPGYFGEPSI